MSVVAAVCLSAGGTVACGEDRPRTPAQLVKCRDKTITECEATVPDANVVVAVDDAANTAAVHAKVVALADESGVSLDQFGISRTPPSVRLKVTPEDAAAVEPFVSKLRSVEHVTAVEFRR